MKKSTIRKLEKLAILRHLIDSEGWDPVVILANVRGKLGCEAGEALDDAAERVMDAHAAKLAELKDNAAREGQEAAELLGEEIGRTAKREAQIAALEKELADACRDASAPVERAPWPDDAETLGSKRESAADHAARLLRRAERSEHELALLESKQGIVNANAANDRQARDAAREEMARLVLTRDTEAEKRTQRLAGELSAAIARAEKAERELEAALRPDGWDGLLDDNDAGIIAHNAYQRAPDRHNAALRSAALAVRDEFVARIRRKAELLGKAAK